LSRFEFAAGELSAAVIGKIFDERIFPRHDFFEVKADFFGADAPRFGMAREMHHFGGVKQCLRRHAAAQDAKSADFLAAFDDGGFQTGGRRHPCRRITAAAAADDRHLKIKLAHGLKVLRRREFSNAIIR
jgi:hypothetical protein